MYNQFGYNQPPQFNIVQFFIERLKNNINIHKGLNGPINNLKVNMLGSIFNNNELIQRLCGLFNELIQKTNTRLDDLNTLGQLCDLTMKSFLYHPNNAQYFYQYHDNSFDIEKTNTDNTLSRILNQNQFNNYNNFINTNQFNNNFPQNNFQQNRSFGFQPVNPGYPTSSNSVHSNQFNNTLNQPKAVQTHSSFTSYSNFNTFNNEQNNKTHAPVEEVVKQEQKINPLLFKGDIVISNQKLADNSFEIKTDISNREIKMDIINKDLNKVVDELDNQPSIAIELNDLNDVINPILKHSDKSIMVNKAYKINSNFFGNKESFDEIIRVIKKSEDYDDLIVKMQKLYSNENIDQKLLKHFDNRISYELERALHKNIDYELGYNVEPIKFMVHKKSIIELWPIIKNAFASKTNVKDQYNKELEKTFRRVKLLVTDTLSQIELEDRYKTIKENYEKVLEQYSLDNNKEYIDPVITINRYIVISTKYTNNELNINFAKLEDYDEKLLIPSNPNCPINKIVKFFENNVEDCLSYTFLLKTIDNETYEISTDINMNKFWISRVYKVMY